MKPSAVDQYGTPCWLHADGTPCYGGMPVRLRRRRLNAYGLPRSRAREIRYDDGSTLMGRVLARPDRLREPV